MRAISENDIAVLNESIKAKGYALLDSMVDKEESKNIVSFYANSQLFRKTISMERYRFGMGEYKYFGYPLPAVVQQLRQQLYQHLFPIANNWFEALNNPQRFPATLEEFLDYCHWQGQTLPTPLMLTYGPGGHNTLHQDIYGAVYFPLQAVVFLSSPDDEYYGGEFVLTEQIPRAQSKATVLRPRRGDILIFATQFRPQKGSRGYYRVSMKHGVSEVHSGERYTLGIIFHDAL